MKIQLIELKPGESLEIFEMIREIGPGENGFMNSLYTVSVEDFQQRMLKYANLAKSVNLPEGFVPQTTYWLYIDDKPVGYGKLRHHLNDNLRERGGHIGYVIRPSERGKGYGNLMLQELLKMASELNIDKVLLTCDEVNKASRRIIENSNGKLTEISEGICKYWIDLI